MKNDLPLTKEDKEVETLAHMGWMTKMRSSGDEKVDSEKSEKNMEKDPKVQMTHEVEPGDQMKKGSGARDSGDSQGRIAMELPKNPEEIVSATLQNASKLGANWQQEGLRQDGRNDENVGKGWGQRGEMMEKKEEMESSMEVGEKMRMTDQARMMQKQKMEIDNLVE